MRSSACVNAPIVHFEYRVQLVFDLILSAAIMAFAQSKEASRMDACDSHIDDAVWCRRSANAYKDYQKAAAVLR